MATSPVISGLVRKHSELQGHKSELQAKLKQTQSEIDALSLCIKLFDPDVSIKTILPKRKINRVPGFERGELSKLVAEYVRDRKNEFLTTDAIDYVLDLKSEYTFNKKELGKIGIRVHAALKRQQSSGVIRETGRTEARGVIIWKKAGQE